MENVSGLNWVDIIFLVLLIYFAMTSKGWLRTLIDLGGFLFSLFASYRLYSFAGGFFSRLLALPKGFAAVLGFFSIWFIAEMLFFLFAYKTFNRFLQKQTSPPDLILGFILGLFQGALMFLFFISLVFALPVRGQIKQDILDSTTGPFFVNTARSFESEVKNVFGGAANETLNFLTVKPESGTTVDLGFKLIPNQITFDFSSESTMYQLVNKERQDKEINSLSFDDGLSKVAEHYAAQMLENGFFSHTSALDGSDASVRVTRAGIGFGLLGENLAFAPDVYIAHQGLMSSEGHRRNILSPDYKKMGIGVADAGIYGKMFVQIFSN